MLTSPSTQTLSIPITYKGKPAFLVTKADSLRALRGSPRAVKASQYKLQGRTGSDSSCPSPSRRSTESGSICEFSTLTDELGSPLDSLMSLHTSDNQFAPGKLKSNSANLTSLVQTTKETLSLYGIQLELDVPGKHFKDVSKILKVLSYEISLFPVGFFKNINLKRLHIFYENDPKKAVNTFSLKADMLENEVKIAERLYKIIYDHLIFAKPKIARAWREHISFENSSGVQDNKELWCLEEVFIALMKNRNHPLLKQLMDTLKGLLKETFPEELTEEWFQNRNNDKKKARRVSFSP